VSAVTAWRRFDYSYEEWTTIENEVAKVRHGSLTDFERRRLLNAAAPQPRAYHGGTSLRQGVLKRK
jgi:hypothetical protein